MRAILCFLLACGDGPGASRIRGEATLETFERRMCACTDVACTQTVVREMTAWSQRLESPRVGSADAAKIMARYNACLIAATKR